jgi:hypothetical protein
MDWSIPQTFYPIALPASLQWLLFAMVIVTTALWVSRVVRHRGWRVGFLVLAPIILLTLLVSMAISMLLTFFIHDF